MKVQQVCSVASTVLFLASGASAISLNLDDDASIRQAAATVAFGLQKYYKNNATNTKPYDVGTFPYPPYYWWESGAAWGAMVDYWTYTKDTSYVDATRQALVAQFGPNHDLMVPNWFFCTGNDDQGFWALSIMNALESGFPTPSPGTPQYLEVAQAAFNIQASRWDTAGCHGGLRWQIFPENAGWGYMNTISNGAFFQLAGRLARYTGNKTYMDWADKAWDWTTKVGLIDQYYNVYDGTDSTTGCDGLNHLQWSYNVGMFLYGAANMYNLTNGAKVWEDRISGLLGRASIFFSPFDNSTDVMFEVACETIETCNTDQQSFKAYLARWMAKTSVLAPFSSQAIKKLLRGSASAAARSCSGGDDGVTCGTKWYVDGWDGTYGMGQQLTALETIQGLLVDKAPALLTIGDVSIPPVQPTSTLTIAPKPTTTVEQFSSTSPTATPTSVASSTPTALPVKGAAPPQHHFSVVVGFLAFGAAVVFV